MGVLFNSKYNTNIMKKIESDKEKRNRKKEFLENKKNVYKVVLPSIGAFTIIICFVVYLFTRPQQ